MPQYLLLTNVQVQQVPTDKYPDRDKLLVFSFLHKYEADSTWANLTQTLTLVLPKNVRVAAYKVTGTPFSINPAIQTTYVQLGNVTGQDSNLGGFDASPTFLRGDLIKFNVGYRAMVNGGETTVMSGQKGLPDQFAGVISLVQPKLPFTIECEDYMWLLKQMPTPKRHWQNKTLGDVVTETMALNKENHIITRYKGYVNLTVSDFAETDLKFNVGNLITAGESLAIFLTRMKSEYRVDSYFRGQQLRVGLLHYLPQDTQKLTFTFQKNILDNDNLKWQRKDDIVLSAVVKSTYKTEGKGQTKDGQTNMINAATEILIYNENGDFNYVVKPKSGDFPTKYLNVAGEQYHFNYQGIPNPEDLFKLGLPQLQKRYYDGFRGSFTTLAIPYVKHGDTVQFINKALPEQEGLYKVKEVRAFGGYDDGGRQEIFLDYKISQ